MKKLTPEFSEFFLACIETEEELRFRKFPFEVIFNTKALPHHVFRLYW